VSPDIQHSRNSPLPNVAPICNCLLKSAGSASLRKRSRWLNTTGKSQSAQSASPGREGTLSSPNPVTPQRGEIWLVNFDPTMGAEIQKTRPAVVVSSDAVGRLPMKPSENAEENASDPS
jgi:hypothetical protein